MSITRKILLAFLAGLLGFTVGAISVSLIGLLKLMVIPESDFWATLHASPLLFLEALLWAVVGGVMYVLPPGFLLLAAYALRFRLEWLEPHTRRKFICGLAALLVAPVLVFGHPGDAAVLAVPMLVGVWTSLTFLNRRLSSPSAA